MVLGWLVIWGPGGYLTAMFNDRLHLRRPPIDTISGMALVEATRLLPIAFLTCQAALSRADSSLEDAARSAGARRAGARQHHDPDAAAGAPERRDADLHALDRGARHPAAARASNNIIFVSSYLYNTWTNASAPTRAR